MSYRISRTFLPNGARIVCVDTPHLHTGVVAAYLRCGSRHESAAHNGVSHLLEHLLFRGTRQHPIPREMNARVEALGGNLNAATSRDSTAIYTPVRPGAAQPAVEIIADMVTAPLLSNLELEKRIIIEELLDELDHRGRNIDLDHLAKRALFGSHPLTHPVGGTQKSVKRIDAPTIRRHWRKYYVGSNLVVGIGGRNAAKVGRKVATRAFAALPKGSRASEAAPTFRAGNQLYFVDHHESQVAIRFSFPAVPELHPDFEGLGLLRRVLDDGLSSRLQHTIVEQRGLAYSIGAQIDAYHDVGIFEIDAACSPQQVGELTATILEVVADLRTRPVATDELRRGQDRLAIHLGFLQDSPGDLLNWFAGPELYARAIPPQEVLKRALRVTTATAQRIANTYLSTDRMVVSAVGPRSAYPRLRRALRHLQPRVHLLSSSAAAIK